MSPEDTYKSCAILTKVSGKNDIDIRSTLPLVYLKDEN